MITDNINLTGKVELILRDSLGNIRESRQIPNLVVTTGKEFVAARMAGTSLGVMTHIEVGTSNVAPVVGNTTLTSAVIASRTAMTVSGGTPSGANILYTALFAPGVGTGNITEAGIFNASTGGVMLCRTIFDAVNKGALDSLTINWTVTVN